MGFICALTKLMSVLSNLHADSDFCWQIMVEGGSCASEGVSADPLCCCEYVNVDGERSHILAVCCDCEAIDDTFDR